jgi:hypothetical protein
MGMTLKAGQRYKSTVWLNPATSEPQVMVITRIAGGAVYYRPDYGVHEDGTKWLGSAAKFAQVNAGRWLGEEVR